MLTAAFDDPDQEPATLHWPNNARLRLPLPGTWVTAYKSEAQGQLGVFLAGKDDALASFWERLAGRTDNLLQELPDGTVIAQEKGRPVLKTIRAQSDFPDDDARRAWLTTTLNQYANALRARLG